MNAKQIADVVQRASEEVKKQQIGLTGGWSNNQRAGRKYRGAVFKDDDGKTWVACRHEQDREHGDLLDVTACFLRATKDAVGAVAILDPEKNKASSSLRIDEPNVAKRLRRAAWRGLNILWVTDPVSDGKDWDLALDGPEDRGDVDAIFGRVEAAMNTALPKLTRTESSRGAELELRKIVGEALGSGFSALPLTQWRYPAFGFRPRNDGVWSRDQGSPRTVALEVKVNEDMTVPFSQIVNNLGTFDAVIQIRLVTAHAKGKKLRDLDGIDDARKAFEKNLPVKILELKLSPD